MLTESQRDRIEVVLVSPRNSLNIGAAARAMVNFGFARLTVVAPYEPHWREARSAVGAEDLLQSAIVATTLAEAVADCTLVIGTGTLAHRKAEQPVVSLPALAPLVAQELVRGGRVALLFGSEKRGLTQKDLSFCHLLGEIPTDARQPSMNLAQAAAVCLYELAVRTDAPAGSTAGVVGADDIAGRRGTQQSAPAAPASSQLDLLAGAIEKVIEAARYSPASMQEANRHDLRLLLRRLTLTERDARRILGFFRRVSRRLER